MAQTVVLGLDLGTSGARVLAVNSEGRTVAEAGRNYPLLTPRPGWTEQNPEDWLQAALDALEEIAGKLQEYDIAALGLSGQMHGMVPLDKTGDVVRLAILWNDQRTGDAVRELERDIGRETLIERTGNPPVTGFQLPKLLWMRRAEPDNFARTRHVLLPKDYLGYALTGEMAAEPSDASGTNCFNLTEKRWDEDILTSLGLDSGLFAEVIASHETVGGLTRDAAHQTGLPEGLPVIAGAGDNAAAATGLGLSSSRPGLGSLSLGTSGVIFAPLQEAKPDPEGRVHLFCHADGGYHLLAVTLAAAGSLQWFRDTLAPGTDFTEMSALAEQSPTGAGGVTFRPYLAGERTPHMNPDLRGSWTGLSLATTRADLVRSVFEGVAFSLRDALEVMAPLSPVSECLATGGGARSDLWLQMTADVLGLPLKRTTGEQGAAYGAALLALQGADLTESAAEAADSEISATFAPGADSEYREALARYRDTRTGS